MALDLYELALRIKSEGFVAAKKNIDALDSQGKSLATRFTGVQKALTGVASAAAVVAVGKFLGNAIKEAADAEEKLNELRQSVNNVGGDFETLRPVLDNAATSMQKFTRFSDDATRGALSRMIVISEDTAGSLKNIGLAADIAAAKHISLESAAEIVGKTMTGNTRGLKEFGITTKDSSEALEQLRTKFRGFAEQDGKSFQGRLEQLKNAWADVLEATGKAIIGGENAAETLGLITTKLQTLSAYIDKNADAWRDWAGKVGAIIGSIIPSLNKALDVIQKIGLSIYAARTGNFGPLDGYGKFRDVTSGSSSGARGDNLPPMVIGGSRGNNTPRSRGGSSGGSGKSSGVAIPGFDMGGIGQAQIDGIGQNASVMIQGIDLNSTPVPGVGMSADMLEDLYKNYHETLKQKGEALKTLNEQLAEGFKSGISQTFGDAVYNGFAAAFNGEGIGGIFEAFGKTILAGLGNIMSQQGQALLAYGIAMQAAAIGLTNPFTAGPAAIMAGAALIALGAAFGAAAKGGGGRGTASAGAFREPTQGADVTRLRFVDSRTGSMLDMQPRQSVNLTVIGTNDPRAQRDIVQLLENAQRRMA